jgi:hypothetical protein
MNRAELAKISYLDPDVLRGRTLLMMPLWDGSAWHQWIPTPDGKVIEIQVVETIHSKYVAKQPAKDTDIWIEFVDLRNL